MFWNRLPPGQDTDTDMQPLQVLPERELPRGATRLRHHTDELIVVDDLTMKPIRRVAIVGIEREVRGRQAGFRTNILQYTAAMDAFTNRLLPSFNRSSSTDPSRASGTSSASC